MASQGYEDKTGSKRPWGWIIGGILFVGLFGSCVFAFGGMFANIGVVQPMNDAFIADILEEGLPEVASNQYSSKSGITDEALEPINRMILTLGPPTEIAETVCGANSNVSTNEVSGQFVECNGTVSYSVSDASLYTRWRKEDETWKLFAFNLNIADANAYGDLVAEKALEEKEQAKTGSESEVEADSE